MEKRENVLRVAFQKLAHIIASSGADGAGHLAITGDNYVQPQAVL